MSYVGELGWELYVPNAHAVTVYEALRDAAADADGLGLAHAGYHAMNTLRLECGYRHWGHDISDEDTPLEAGLGFAIAWDKPRDFIGRAALEEQRHEPRTRRLIQFRLEDPDVLAYHDEPIRRDGELVGRVTSAMWSYTQDRCLAMGYVTHPTARRPRTAVPSPSPGSTPDPSTSRSPAAASRPPPRSAASTTPPTNASTCKRAMNSAMTEALN